VHSWWYEFGKDYVVGPLVGVLAIIVAVRAYKSQVTPLYEQIALTKELAKKERDQREFSIAWAVLLEGRRIHQAAFRRLETIHRVTQPGEIDNRVSRERMMIPVSDLIRGNRADISLMHIRHQTLAFRLIQVVDQYNAVIETEQQIYDHFQVADGGEPQRLLTAIRDKAIHLCEALERAYQDKIADPSLANLQ
jgi:hypothetical protein